MAAPANGLAGEGQEGAAGGSAVTYRIERAGMALEALP